MSEQELLERRGKLVLDKRELENKLIAVKNIVRTGGRMANEKYKQCCDTQKKYSADILKIERELSDIKMKLRQISVYDVAEKKAGKPTEPQPSVPRDFVVSLVDLRSEYQRFAADMTRVSSMRQMAAEFALKLNPIIKAAMKGVDVG